MQVNQLRFDRPQAAAGRTPIEDVQSLVEQDRVLLSTPDEDGLLLQPGSETIFLQQKGEARGTLLMFHGYTAGPWQYKELAGKFHDAGYHVLVRRMPGHGYMTQDGTPTGQKLPSMARQSEWDRFIDDTFSRAQALGAPVHAIGLSGGGNVALRMGERHNLAGVVAMAPYLGGDWPKGIVFSLVDVIDHCTFGLFGRLVLDRIPYNKNVKEVNDPTPHVQGTLGQARAMRRVGAMVKSVQCPVQLITTDGDKLSGRTRCGKLLQRLSEPTGWFRFTQAQQVPHAMVSPVQNLNRSSVAQIQQIVFDFVTRGQLQ